MSGERPSGDVPHSTLEGDQGARVYEEGFIESESKIERSDPRQNFALWIAVLGSAVVWFIQLNASYSLVMWACASGKQWTLHAASVLFLVLAAVPGWIAWQQWVAAGSGERESAGDGRRRFMAMLGLLLTALFVLLILAQAIPSFFFDACLD